MNYMRNVILELDKAGLRSKVKVMVGGAPSMRHSLRKSALTSTPRMPTRPSQARNNCSALLEPNDASMRTRQVDINYKDLTIDRQEIYRAMGYGDETPEPEILDMLNEVLSQAQRVCKPCFLYRICNGQVMTPLHIEIGGVNFRPGKIITDSLAGAELFCLFVATAGREFEEFRHTYKESGDCVREFIADSVGSVLAEACVAKLEQQLDCDLEIPHTLPYSPGYCGWRVTEQHLLFGMLPDRPCGIELTESSLMYPIKSVSGIIGIGSRVERKPYGCAICRNTACYKRRIS